jgi:hypothetical protein
MRKIGRQGEGESNCFGVGSISLTNVIGWCRNCGMPKSKHCRRRKVRSQETGPEPVTFATSVRGREILGAQTAIVEARLRETIGTEREWTRDDYGVATRQLLAEGILDSSVILEILPELTRIS